MDDKKDLSKDGMAISNKKPIENKKPVGRPKGLPKTGGRKKAPETYAKHQWDEVLRRNLFSIPDEAIKLFFHKDTSNPLKFSILQFLAQYTTPAIKAKEATDPEVTDPGSGVQTNGDILAIVKP